MRVKAADVTTGRGSIGSGSSGDSEDSRDSAESAGSADYQRVASAIRFLDERFREQPSLETVAASVGLSVSHFQRLFRRWAGVSPKRFLQFATLAHAREMLRESRPLLATSFEAGLSGPGRLHDLFVSAEGVTPGEFKAAGAGVLVRHGTAPTRFGDALLGFTDRGLCGLRFLDPSAGRDAALALEELRGEWPRAKLIRDDEGAAAIAASIFGRRRGAGVALHLRGTNFQLRVWEALLRIPPGAVSSYQDVAEGAGARRAVRAVGSAIGRNPVAWVIPCHRVIRKTGAFGAYRWGSDRKRVMLAYEAAMRETASSSRSTSAAVV